MRKGQNPAKMGLPAYQPRQIGLAVLTCIPTQEGYFAQALEILKYQLASLRQTAPEADLLVFDNGSCLEVQAELQALHAGKWIDYLVLSNHNVGKTGALNWILSALPNELIGYADGDVLFRPGWLEASLQILNAFPEAGLVSVQPTPFEVLPGEGQASKMLEGMAQYEISCRPLDPLVVEEYGRGIGLEAEKIGEFKRKPVRMITNLKTGTQAVIGPTHMQFLLKQAVARRILPLPATRALFREETKKINERIDEIGLVQLTTLQPYVYHLGNELDDTALKEIHERGLDEGRERKTTPTMAKAVKTSSAKHRGLQLLANLSRWTFFRRTFQRLYNFLFEYYSQAK